MGIMLIQRERLLVVAIVAGVAITLATLTSITVRERTRTTAAIDIVREALTNATGHVVVRIDIQLGDANGKNTAPSE